MKMTTRAEPKSISLGHFGAKSIKDPGQNPSQKGVCQLETRVCLGQLETQNLAFSSKM